MKRLRVALVKVRLWEEREGGVQTHDYNHFQLTAAQMRKKSEARAEAGRLGGKRSGEARRSKRSNGEAIASPLLQRAAKQQASLASKPDLDLGSDLDPNGGESSLVVTRGMSIPEKCTATFARVAASRAVLMDVGLVWTKFVNKHAGRRISLERLDADWESWCLDERAAAPPAPSKARPRQGAGSAGDAPWRTAAPAEGFR